MNVARAFFSFQDLCSDQERSAVKCQMILLNIQVRSRRDLHKGALKPTSRLDDVTAAALFPWCSTGSVLAAVLMKGEWRRERWQSFQYP